MEKVAIIVIILIIAALSLGAWLEVQDLRNAYLQSLHGVHSTPMTPYTTISANLSISAPTTTMIQTTTAHSWG